MSDLLYKLLIAATTILVISLLLGEKANVYLAKITKVLLFGCFLFFVKQTPQADYAYRYDQPVEHQTILPSIVTQSEPIAANSFVKKRLLYASLGVLTSFLMYMIWMKLKENFLLRRSLGL